MARVTSLGGIFFKCSDPKAQHEWYRKHLGINTGDYGTNFEWRKSDKPEEKGYTVWSAFKEDTNYFEPSEKPFMINFRVDDLTGLLTKLKEEGIEQLGEIQDFDYGRFAWIIDPEGHKIELWQPNDENYESILSTDVTK